MDNQFAKDVSIGLTACPKFLHSKYFYDDKGSRIFREIMEMSEYYLTNCEFEIFSEQAADIHARLNFAESFNLVELGAGDGLKTAEIIQYLIQNDIDFVYKPVDISQEANDLLVDRLSAKFPSLKIKPETGDYFEVLKDMQFSNTPSLVLFIGSNIGNYTQTAAQSLFNLLNQTLKQGDKLLVGVDLKKNPHVIHKAYSDPHGITKRFNLNLLERINRELGGNFIIDQFDFYANYDPSTGEVKSYIVSLMKQDVYIEYTDSNVSFTDGETIWTELSKKYNPEELEQLVTASGFKHVHHFRDNRNYFCDSLFEK